MSAMCFTTPTNDTKGTMVANNNNDGEVKTATEEHQDRSTAASQSNSKRSVEEQQEQPPDTELSPPTPLYPPNRVFSQQQLEVLNVLVQPVWIFDIDNKCMKWANEAAVELWNASSLQELLDRNYGDMTDATFTRLKSYQPEFNQGQRIFDQSTLYPKGEAKTVHLTISGIRLSAGEPNPSMLCEGRPVLNDTIQPETLRGVEMLRHLPVPVCQFDMNGKLIYKNPEGTLPHITPRPTQGGGEGQAATANERTTSTPSTDTHHEDFVSRFVDRKVGQEALEKMRNILDTTTTTTTTDHAEPTLNLQANVRTRVGPRWSAIQLRRTFDPLTGKPAILYSSRDMSDAIQAQKEREARIKKSEFLAIMAHEIRTPLHQVTGFIDLLDQTELDTEQRSFVKLMKSSAQGLMTVINDVLDYSKLEAGKMKLETIPYEPRSVLEGTMAAVQGSCEEKKLYLKMSWDKDIPFKVMGDPNRLRQILLNLLSNAVKFTKQGGIHVQAVPWKSSSPGLVDGSMVKFIVDDTGRGINPAHKDIIFDQYQQGSVTVARNFGGTGLGLSICKLLVQNMGGSIGMESQEGKGSSFWFTLPAEVPTECEVIEKVPLEASFRDEAALHILVAEDNKVNQKLLTSMLKRMGHTCEIALNGKIAIKMLEEKPNDYNAVLMDIQMPVMDGLEATRRIRSMGYTDLPILGLTASVARSDFTELGFNDWLPKPIPMKELRTKLYRIQHKEQQQQQQQHVLHPPLPIQEKQ